MNAIWFMKRQDSLEPGDPTQIRNKIELYQLERALEEYQSTGHYTVKNSRESDPSRRGLQRTFPLDLELIPGNEFLLQKEYKPFLEGFRKYYLVYSSF